MQGKSLNKESQEKPYMTPSIISQRDDEVDNVNIGVAYVAPSYRDP